MNDEHDDIPYLYLVYFFTEIEGQIVRHEPIIFFNLNDAKAFVGLVKIDMGVLRFNNYKIEIYKSILNTNPFVAHMNWQEWYLDEDTLYDNDRVESIDKNDIN